MLLICSRKHRPGLFKVYQIRIPYWPMAAVSESALQMKIRILQRIPASRTRKYLLVSNHVRQLLFPVEGCDISLDEEKISPFLWFYGGTEEQVSSGDQKLLKLIRLPLITNLFRIGRLKDLIKREISPERNLHPLLRTQAASRYMQIFLEAHRENHPLFPAVVETAKLVVFRWSLRTATVLSESGILWTEPRNLVAGINSRKGSAFDELATERDRAFSMVIGRNDVAEQILCSCPDFGLSSILPCTESTGVLQGYSSVEKAGLIRWRLSLWTAFPISE